MITFQFVITEFLSIEPPGPPRGPLEVSGMTRTSFTIKWEPPENDGGTPITDYIIEIKESSKKTWQKVNITSFSYVNSPSRLQISVYAFSDCHYERRSH